MYTNTKTPIAEVIQIRQARVTAGHNRIAQLIAELAETQAEVTEAENSLREAQAAS